MNILLAIQNYAHQDHLEGRFPELKFIVDGTPREATASELDEHGFGVRPEDVNFVASCVNPFGIEGLYANGFTLDGLFDGPKNLTVEDALNRGFHVPPEEAASWEIAVAMDVEVIARKLRLIYAKGNPCN